MTHKAAFASETEDAAMKVTESQMQVADDMDDLDVDPDYATFLGKQCNAYVQQEYDFYEVRQMQLRELVTLAEGEMHGMRERVKTCQEFVGENMFELGKRLESLEHVVHHSLEDLVHLANGAN